jgi:hypothetical protein
VAEQEEVHRAVLTEDNRRAAYRALQDRILNGEGRVSPVARVGDRRGLVGSLGVGAEHLHQHPHREDRRDHQEAVAEEGVQADGLA